MKRKRRPAPLSQGHLRKIWELFLKPLMHYKAPTQTSVGWLTDGLFHISAREIVFYRAKESFVMPGLVLVAPGRAVQGLRRDYEVAAGSEVIVRTDEATPEAIEVQAQNGPGKKDVVYRLDRSEWRFVRGHLTDWKGTASV